MAFSDWQDLISANREIPNPNDGPTNDFDFLPRKEIERIIMRGTAPTFYKMTITKELLQAVGEGTCPRDYPLFVRKLRPPVEDQEKYFKEGLKTLDNRKIIMQCFEAFKRILPHDVDLSQA